MFELIIYKKEVNLFMKCLFTEDSQFYHSSKVTKIPKYRSVQILLYYWIFICISVHHKFDKTWNLFSEKKTSLRKPADIYVYYYVDIQCWKTNNICSTWKIMEKLKIVEWFTCIYCSMFTYFIFPPKFPDHTTQKIDSPSNTTPPPTPQTTKFSNPPQQILI